MPNNVLKTNKIKLICVNSDKDINSETLNALQSIKSIGIEDDSVEHITSDSSTLTYSSTATLNTNATSNIVNDSCNKTKKRGPFYYYNNTLASDNKKGSTLTDVWSQEELLMDGRFIIAIGQSPYYVVDDSAFDAQSGLQIFLKTHKKTPHFFECVIGNKRQKLRFDFDGDLETTNKDWLAKFFETLIITIQKVFHDIFSIPLGIGKELVVTDSSSEVETENGSGKYSKHIIINGYCVENNHECNLFYERVMQALMLVNAKYHNIKIVDSSIYKSFQQFRLLNSCKKGTSRFKRLPKTIMVDGEMHEQNATLFDTLLTNTNECILLPKIVQPSQLNLTQKVSKKQTNGDTENIGKEITVDSTIAGLVQRHNEQEQMELQKTIDSMKLLLKIIDKSKRMISRKDWINVGLIIYNEVGATSYDEGLEMYQSFCDLEYHVECSETFKSFKVINGADGSGTRSIRLGTLISWAKEDCPQLFQQPFSHYILEEPSKYTLEYLHEAANGNLEYSQFIMMEKLKISQRQLDSFRSLSHDTAKVTILLRLLDIRKRINSPWPSICDWEKLNSTVIECLGNKDGQSVVTDYYISFVCRGSPLNSQVMQVLESQSRQSHLHHNQKENNTIDPSEVAMQKLTSWAREDSPYFFESPYEQYIIHQPIFSFEQLKQFVEESYDAYEIVLHQRKDKKNRLPIYDTNIQKFPTKASVWGKTLVSTHDIVTHLCDCMAFIFNGGKGIVVSKTLTSLGSIDWKEVKFTEWKNNIGDLPILTFDQKNNDYCHIPLRTVMRPHWVDLQFDTIGFIPFGNEMQQAQIDPRIFNKFVGFHGATVAYDLRQLTIEKQQEIIETFLEHVTLLCGDEVELCMSFILGWMAHLIQFPCKKEEGGICLLFRSGQGTGKNIFWKFFGEYVIGKRYYKYFNRIEQVTGNFNALMENALLNFLDEVQNYGGAFKNNDYLKSLITETDIIIEKKNVDACSSLNYARSVMASNNEWPAKVTPDDRRYFCCEPSTSKKGDADYFNNIVNVLHNDIAGKVIFEFLQKYDLSTWNPKKIPLTKFRKELMERSEPNIEKFLRFLCSDEFQGPHTNGGFTWHPAKSRENEIVYTPAELFREYLKWFKENNFHTSVQMESDVFRKKLQEYANDHKSEGVVYRKRKWKLNGDKKDEKSIPTFSCNLHIEKENEKCIEEVD
jgi:hypothetical protein